VLQLQRTAGNAAVGRWLSRAEITDVEVPAAVTTPTTASSRTITRCATSATRAPRFVRGAGEDASGVDANDIVQGFIGDCFFLSPLMATARINPSRVAKLVRGPIGQQRLRGQALQRLRRPRHAPHRRPLHLQRRRDAALRAVRRPVGGRPGAVGDADGEGVGGPARRLQQHGLRAVADGKPVVCNTPATITGPALAWATAAGISLVNAHSYNVAGANKTARTIDVQNPHGRNHLPGLAVGDFRMIFEWSGILDSSVK
jgi:hypothetical protein